MCARCFQRRPSCMVRRTEHLCSFHTSVSAGRAIVRGGTSENRQQWLHLISSRSKQPLVANTGSGSDYGSANAGQRLHAVSFGRLPSDLAEYRTKREVAALAAHLAS